MQLPMISWPLANPEYEMNAFSYQYRMLRFLRYLIALLACAPLAGWASCTGGGQTIVLSQLPGTISVARDLPAGSMLTNWVVTPATTNYFSCTTSNNQEGTRAQLGPGFTTSSGLSTTYSGVTVTVYNTNVPGIGIAIASRIYVGWDGYSWQGWANPPASWSGLTITGQSGTNVSGGGQVAVALVKTGAYVQTGTVNAVTVLQQAPVDAGSTMTAYAVSYQIPAVTIVPMTCMTPDVNIPMGIHNANEMPSVGSLSANPTAFNIQINSCPGGTDASGTNAGSIHTVQYQIVPTSGTVSGFTNVATIASGGAGGVGIQLFDGNSNVVPYSTPLTLNGYNSAAGGSYSIPMTARYYRTGTLTGGPANATMTVMMSYQ